MNKLPLLSSLLLASALLSGCAAELVSNATRIADGFAAVRPDQWGRTGRRSNGSVFTVDTLARYFTHDPVHHLHDVGG